MLSQMAVLLQSKTIFVVVYTFLIACAVVLISTFFLYSPYRHGSYFCAFIRSVVYVGGIVTMKELLVVCNSFLLLLLLFDDCFIYVFVAVLETFYRFFMLSLVCFLLSLILMTMLSCSLSLCLMMMMMMIYMGLVVVVDFVELFDSLLVFVVVTILVVILLLYVVLYGMLFSLLLIALP